MKNQNYRYFGKWSAICAVAAVFAASGQACPPEMPPVPVPSLTGVWTGPISGEATSSRKFNTIPPTNPNPNTADGTFQTVGTVQIVFDDSARLVTLPLVLSAFSSFFSEQALTAFDVGETQTFANTFTNVSPTGATDTNTFGSSFTTTLTVIESVLTMDHFRVVYETTNILVQSQSSTVPMSVPSSSTQSSTGTLTFDATLMNGQLMFSADFNINGSGENLSGGATIQTANGFVVGSLTGTLASN